MKATTIIVAFALIVALTSAQNTTFNATGLSCSADHSICASKNPLYCCANVVRTINATFSNSTQVCVNQTVAAKTVEYKNFSSVFGNATCIVDASTGNNSFLVKLSVAVASLGFLSLFL